MPCLPSPLEVYGIGYTPMRDDVKWFPSGWLMVLFMAIDLPHDFFLDIGNINMCKLTMTQ